MGADIPKQYLEVCGRPVISFALERLLCHKGIDAVHVAAQPAWRESIRKWLADWDLHGKFRGFCTPGENRQLSILHGLEEIRAYAEDTDRVLIHDAVRPLISEEQITACLKAAGDHEGAMPVLPVKDTVYASRNGTTVSALLCRNEIFAGQAPEVFIFGKYYEANRRLLPDRIRRISGSAEPAVLAGMDIAMIPGDEDNFKITTKADLERFVSIMSDDAGRREEKGKESTE